MFSETLEMLERGQLVKDYNANMTGVDSEDEDDPRTPTSVSSQEGQGMDFVDVEAFTVIPDCALPELNLQVNILRSFLRKIIWRCHFLSVVTIAQKGIVL